MSGVVMRGVELVDAEIHGEIVNVTINGVDIGPLITAEPDKAISRPTQDASERPRRLLQRMGCH